MSYNVVCVQCHDHDIVYTCTYRILGLGLGLVIILIPLPGYK
jgi:hypothetical protein